MVNVGLMGDINVGKTTLLKLFVDYVEKQEIGEIEGGAPCKVVRKDFSGESKITIDGEDTDITISPNKVVFKNKSTNKSHTLFAPGGHIKRGVVKMGIITISRVARQIVVLIDVSRDLKSQLSFFNDVRYLPNELNVCFNKVDLLNVTEVENKIKAYESEIIAFFAKKKIKVKSFYRTCGLRDMNGMTEFNENVARMLLSITGNSVSK